MGRKKAAEPQFTGRKGEFSPKKADVEAFKNGNLTPLMKRNCKIIDTVSKAFRARQKALDAFDRAMEKMFAVVSPDGKGRTVTLPDDSLRFVVSMDATVQGNYMAEQAELLIGQYADELMTKRTLSEDERTFGAFLTSIIQRRRGAIRMTPALTEFLKKEFSDPRLKEAQELLRNGFDAKETKPRFYMMVKDADGAWKGAKWSEESKKWVQG